MSLRGRVLVTAGAVILFVAVAGAPFALMLVPNPRPVAVADIGAELPGSYISSAGQTYRVFPNAAPVASFPADAPVVGADAVFIVKYRQLAELSAYVVRTFDGDRGIGIERDTSEPGLLRLRPRVPLPPGRYYAIVARESIYGGEDYVYFSVAKGATR